MDVDYINPFVESAVNVFKTMLNCDVSRTGLALKDSFAPEYDMTGIIGLSGKASGDVVISFEQSLALRATEILVGEKYEEVNDDVVDTIGELTNMIAGYAKSNMEQLELSLALPTVIVGDNHSIRFTSNVKPISMPFECEWGKFNIEVGLVQNV